MSPLLWLKLKKYSKLENYIAFVQSTDLSKVPPLSRGDTNGLKRPDVPGCLLTCPFMTRCGRSMHWTRPCVEIPILNVRYRLCSG